jgi:mRNA interferase RelE/StbE
MTYELRFLPSALKEWERLPSRIRERFKVVLKRRLTNPRPRGEGLRHYANHYNIKLQSEGYRLVYEVDDQARALIVICAGRRDRVYTTLLGRKA